MTSQVKGIIKKNPNVTCLFTENDWKVWEEITKRNDIKNTNLKGTYRILHLKGGWIYKCKSCGKTFSYYGGTWQIKKHVYEIHPNGRPFITENWSS